tara:strand:- start:247 stop:597 length:351 start_codon:yes stop_codon:yes gene_type:complete
VYIAIVKSEGDKIAKYQEFDTEAKADAHVLKYGGFVSLSPDGPTTYWKVDPVAKTVTFDKDQSDKDKAHLVATAYVGKRENEYPSIGDQLDALWKGGDDQAAMKVIINKVKSDYPK